MRRIITLLLVSALLLPITGSAQDPHFSQYYASPHIVNPAFTGLFQGTSRLAVQYKNQWGEFVKNGYNTGSLLFDQKMNFDNGCDFMGVGGNLIYDRAGALAYQTIYLNGDFSYFKSLNGFGTQYISAGISLGAAQRSLTINPETDFLDVPESLPTDNYWFYDFSGGIMWYAYPQKQSYFYLGAALYHINNPEQSFFANSRGLIGTQELLYRKLSIHAGADLVLTENFSLQPTALYYKQGPATELNLGTFLKYRLGRFFEVDRFAMYVGGWYRYQDAIIGALRVDWKNMYYTLSYDINTSNFKSASSGRGGVELSIVRTITNKKKKVNCPSPVDCPKI